MNDAITWLKKIKLSLLGGGFFVAGALLLKFLADFSHLSGLIVLPLALLIGVAVLVSASNVFAKSKTRSKLERRECLLLTAAVPLGFLASSLDCTGLSFGGCTTYCTIVKTLIVPLLAVLSFAYYRTNRAPFLIAAMVASWATLVPHCLCYNPANAWWIDHFGASPQCYVWGFATTIIAASALLKRVRPWASIAVCYAIIIGAFGFFVGHHYFRFPW